MATPSNSNNIDISDLPSPSSSPPDISDLPDPGPHPVTAELTSLLTNEAKALPRNIMTGTGQLADFAGSVWDTAFHPEGVNDGADDGTNYRREPGKAPAPHEHPMFTAIANEVADRLGLPKAEGTPLERSMSAGVRGAVGAVPFGPEAVIPSF